MTENPYKAPEAEEEKWQAATAPDPSWLMLVKVGGVLLASAMFAVLVYAVKLIIYGTE
jgi:hypothetical protein